MAGVICPRIIAKSACSCDHIYGFNWWFFLHRRQVVTRYRGTHCHGMSHKQRIRTHNRGIESAAQPRKKDLSKFYTPILLTKSNLWRRGYAVSTELVSCRDLLGFSGSHRTSVWVGGSSDNHPQLLKLPAIKCWSPLVNIANQM